MQAPKTSIEEFVYMPHPGARQAVNTTLVQRNWTNGNRKTLSDSAL